MKQHYQGLGHIAVYTADMDASIAFYKKIGGSLHLRAPACPPEQQLPLLFRRAACISGPPPARRTSSGSWPLWSSAASWWS